MNSFNEMNVPPDEETRCVQLRSDTSFQHLKPSPRILKLPVQIEFKTNENQSNKSQCSKDRSKVKTQGTLLKTRCHNEPLGCVFSSLRNTGARTMCERGEDSRRGVSIWNAAGFSICYCFTQQRKKVLILTTIEHLTKWKRRLSKLKELKPPSTHKSNQLPHIPTSASLSQRNLFWKSNNLNCNFQYFLSSFSL